MTDADCREEQRIPNVRQTPGKRGRLVVVSNRLPVTVEMTEGNITYTPSTGGLATGLGALCQELEMQWIGWPGTVPKKWWAQVTATLEERHGCHPVFLSERQVERYYDGFSNRTIWPLFHSFPAYTKYAADEWEAYKQVNRLFAENIARFLQPNDLVWVHDYHLMLLPAYVRDLVPRITLGFFLHIPFPTYDIFRLLPQRREIIEGLLAADLIGFHTYDYAQSFLGCVRRLQGYDNSIGQVLVGDRLVQVDVFPMGIDFQKYSAGAHTREAQREAQAVRRSISSAKVFFSVSRLDYTKGIPESLDAVEEFMRRFPEWHGKVTYVLVIVPSREKVVRYAMLKREIDERVGNINSAYGGVDWTPIKYIYRSLRFEELVGLYAAADVALILPLRDGMNLIAKEYLAARTDGTGVLVLSEMAGASKELFEAVIVNPNSKEEVAEGLATALAMPTDEQQRRNAVMRDRLKLFNVQRWSEHFLQRLRFVADRSTSYRVRLLTDEGKKELLRCYASARRRLIILDYDGTLVPFAPAPDLAEPDGELLALLKRLGADARNRVVVLSGRERTMLERWLASLPVTLVAEHGGWVKQATEDHWQGIAANEEGWKEDVRPIFDLFVDRIPGSFVEEKTYSLVWHYRRAETNSAILAARELLDTLSGLVANLDLRVLPGNKSIEVRNAFVSKGAFYISHLAGGEHDFILAMGDDWTDEDLFAALPPSAYSFKVGLQSSKAKFNIGSVSDARTLLAQLEG